MRKLQEWVKDLEDSGVGHLPDAAFDIYTDMGEDGIIAYLLSKMENVPTYFLDIGSGNCVRSNCATLAVHLGWQGVFIDKNEKQLEIGKKYYAKRPAGAKVKFIGAEVRPDTINKILEDTELPGEIGVMSIDIDGNDLWIWKAIENVRPRLVVIEAKVEFGFRKIAVPYSQSNNNGIDKMFNGASVEAMREIGKQKGYKLVGSNRPGYNLFFVQEKEALRAEDTAIILSNVETIDSFYPEKFFAKHHFENL